MKKLLNISVIAALAILPLAANATDLTLATHGTIVAADATKVATTGYVKGAYNELGEAINTKQDKLSPEQLQAIQDVTTLNSDVSALKTTVGGAGSGLVKAVADNTSDISALKTTVGNSTSGLVKDVADLETAVGDSTSGLVKDVADLETTVGDANSGLVKAVAGNTSDITALDGRLDTAESDITALQTASGDYATKTAAENMVETAQITATVPTLTTWGNDNSNGTVGVTVSSIAATYAEPPAGD